LPCDFLKIDGSLVRDVDASSADRAITRAILFVAHELGIPCIAEWAETPAIVRSLMDLGADYAQGYGLSRPLPPQALLEVGDCSELVSDPVMRETLLSPARGARLAPASVRLVAAG